MQILLAFLTTFIWFTPAIADSFAVVASDGDHTLTIFVPDGFRAATTPTDIARRDRNLAFYNDNKKIRGTYWEVFRTKWPGVDPFPVIFVSTLGTTSAMQGTLSRSAWEELRAEFQAASRSQIRAIRDKFQPAIRENYPYGEYHVHDELAWAIGDDEDKAIIMTMTEFDVNGVRYNELGARTIYYKDGYLVVLDFKTDATAPNAMESIESWIDKTEIISIGP